MPRKFSQTVFPAKSFGSANSLRYHHETAYGLSGGMGKFEKFAPMGYDTPGYCRRFIPSKGSGSAPLFTCAATTVVGTFALIQSFGWNDGLAIASPFSETLAEDCKAQPSFRENLGSADLEPCANPVMHKKAGTRIETRSREAFMKCPR